MTIHPLFAGFHGSDVHRVARALGFAAHVETNTGALPDVLPAAQSARLAEGGDLYGFRFAGGWESPGVHCLFFAKPLTTMSASWFATGLS